MIFSINQYVAFDTNIFLFGLRKPKRISCEKVLTNVPQLYLFIPFQVQVELRKNLPDKARRAVFAVLDQARHCRHEHQQPPLNRIRFWELQGAKKGDAVICAALEAADVKFLISENRHFLQEINELPFEVLSAQNLLDKMQP